MNEFTITEKLMHCTVRIECLDENLKLVSTGTGFIMNFLREEGLHLPVIITNKHVITDSKIGRICFTAAIMMATHCMESNITFLWLILRLTG